MYLLGPLRKYHTLGNTIDEWVKQNLKIKQEYDYYTNIYFHVDMSYTKVTLVKGITDKVHKTKQVSLTKHKKKSYITFASDNY